MDREVFINKIKSLFEFTILLSIFPYAKHVLRFYNIRCLTSYADRAIIYAISRMISVEGDVLEIGFSNGGSSLALAAGNELSQRKATVWLIEPNPSPNKELFLNTFKLYNLDKCIKLIDKTSEEARKIINPKLRFLFINGSHRYEDVKKDILLWQDSLKENGVIAFHDYEFPGVSKAINELIVNSNKFVVLGTTRNILYASKGRINDDDLLSRLQKLNRIRKKLRFLL